MKTRNKATCFFTITTFFLILSISCRLGENHTKIFLLESITICANPNPNAKSYGKISAARFTLQSTKKEDLQNDFYFKNNLFYGNTFSDSFAVSNLNLTKSTINFIDNKYQLVLYMECEDVKSFFPARQNPRGDNCYQTELANMIGEGKVYLKKNNKMIEVKKSPDFTFYIGARPKGN